MALGKQIAFIGDLVRTRLTNTNRPLSAIVNLTDRCNLKCAYCYATYHDRGKHELETDQVLWLLGELRDLGCRRVSLAGGEPLLRDDLEVILDRCSQLGLMSTINSNGVLVPDQITLMKKADTLCMSLDGDEKSHDVYRGAGSHAAVMAALAAGRSASINMMTNTVLTKRNLDQVDTILEAAREYGFQALFNVSIGLLSGKGDSFKAEADAIRDALQRLIELKRSGAPILTSEQALRYCIDWPDYGIEFIQGREPDFPYVPCLAGRRFVTVDTNGDVFPCGHLMNSSYTPKNVLDVGVAEAIDHSGQHDCRACYHVSHNEFNLLFAGRLPVLANILAAGANQYLGRVTGSTQ